MTMMRGSMRLGALVLFLAALGFPLSAPADPIVYLDPDSTTVAVSDSFDVRLMINDEFDTFSNFQVVLRFDPNVVELSGVDEGSLYVSSGYQTFFHVEEESLGSWEIFEVIFPFSSFVLAPGELAVIHFRALAEGETPIEFLSEVVMDIDRVEIHPIGSVDGHVTVAPTVGVEGAEAGPIGWSVGAPFPNPTRGSASIRLARPIDARSGDCRLSVYDARGRLVREIDLPAGAGPADLVWDGRGVGAAQVPSGVYFFRLETPEETVRRKVVLIR